jgi:hypothetical protein
MLEVNETVTATDPEVHQILGVAHYDDPAQAVRRMIRCGVPHLRVGRRIRLHIPSLKLWAVARLTPQIELQDRDVALFRRKPSRRSPSRLGGDRWINWSPTTP